LGVKKHLGRDRNTTGGKELGKLGRGKRMKGEKKGLSDRKGEVQWRCCGGKNVKKAEAWGQAGAKAKIRGKSGVKGDHQSMGNVKTAAGQCFLWGNLGKTNWAKLETLLLWALPSGTDEMNSRQQNGGGVESASEEMVFRHGGSRGMLVG